MLESCQRFQARLNGSQLNTCNGQNKRHCLHAAAWRAMRLEGYPSANWHLCKPAQAVSPATGSSCGAGGRADVPFASDVHRLQAAVCSLPRHQQVHVAKLTFQVP